MKRLGAWIAVIVASVCLAASSSAATMAYWDFEDGVDGQEFTPTGQPNGSGGSADTVSGILMRGWNEQYGPAFTSQTATGSGLAMNLEINAAGGDNTSDGYVTEGALHGWSPTQWTIETTVNLRALNGWRTLIGRDGSSQGEPESDFYLVKNGIDNKFRINIDTVGGTRWVLDGEPVGGVQTDTWYALAARSDGQTLSLWLDEGDGYEMLSSLDISAQSVAQNALPGTNIGWTFGRGWYSGGFVDHVNGIMDNVRFSDVALDASQMIPLQAIPEPATYWTLLASLMAALTWRRRYAAIAVK
jgi:hypothetical protein